IVFPSEKAAGYFSANVSPTTHSSAPSRNHRPPSFHQGCVALAPVANFVPSGTGTSCWYHVPIKVVAPPVSETYAGTSRNGVNPKTLCRQKKFFFFFPPPPLFLGGPFPPHPN